MDSENIKLFYDNFSEKQIKTGLNDRITKLYNRLLKMGLNKNSRILELGCGVGILTRLLNKKIKTGYLESVDLSPASIESVKNNIKRKNNLFLTAADIVNYTPAGKSFDIITLFDVIEHIPVDLHLKLFENISKIMDKNTVLLINIPSPQLIKYTRKNNPELLQIIDQEINLNELTNNLIKNNLIIQFFENYSIWNYLDYQFFIVKKNVDFTEKDFKLKISIKDKILRKLSRDYLKMGI